MLKYVIVSMILMTICIFSGAIYVMRLKFYDFIDRLEERIPY